MSTLESLTIDVNAAKPLVDATTSDAGINQPGKHDSVADGVLPT